MLTTVQDAGRYGYAHLGISPAGAADGVALRIVNLLVGNDANAAALEMTLLGATLEFDEGALIALAGTECDCKLNGAVVPMWQALPVPPGGVLACGRITKGARVYLGVAGGLDVPRVMGSSSTLLAGGFGGLQGRKLEKGDVLRLGKQRRGSARGERWLAPGAIARIYAPGPIRVTRGAQQDRFRREAYDTFLSWAYTVSEDSNRAGLRLKGPPLKARKESPSLTGGIPLGAIQVPRDGQPIILFVDQQTTGGYPKIANVIAADMHRIGQLRPRDDVRFKEVTMKQAARLVREQEQWLAKAVARQRPPHKLAGSRRGH